MKFPSLLALSAIALIAPTAFAGTDAAPTATAVPEAGMFAPLTATPVAKGHPAWESIVSVEAKGLPLRAVLAAAFESAKIQYAVDPGLDATIYASVREVTLREAVTILGRLADFDVRAENGVWYAQRRRPKTDRTTVVTTTTTAKAPSALTGTIARTKTTIGTNSAGSNSGGTRATVATQTIFVDAPTAGSGNVPMRISPPAPLVRTSFPVGALPETAPARTASSAYRPIVRSLKTVAKTATTAAKAATAKPALNRRVTTRLPKTDLREVFESFSQQTGVAIVVEENVPRYKIDAYMKGCSLKYALDRICAAAGLKYETHGAALRIVKA